MRYMEQVYEDAKSLAKPKVNDFDNMDKHSSFQFISDKQKGIELADRAKFLEHEPTSKICPDVDGPNRLYKPGTKVPVKKIEDGMSPA